MEVIACFVGIALFAWSTYKLCRVWRGLDKSPDPDFDLLTVEEKRRAVDDTAEDLEEAEQLMTDLSLCSDAYLMSVRVKWLGDDGEKHSYDIICDGTNTASVNLAEIMEREVCELRESLAYRCEKLALSTRRSGKNSGKNDEKRSRGGVRLWHRDA